MRVTSDPVQFIQAMNDDRPFVVSVIGDSCNTYQIRVVQFLPTLCSCPAYFWNLNCKHILFFNDQMTILLEELDKVVQL